jgi:hypothetical protein
MQLTGLDEPQNTEYYPHKTSTLCSPRAKAKAEAKAKKLQGVDIFGDLDSNMHMVCLYVSADSNLHNFVVLPAIAIGELAVVSCMQSTTTNEATMTCILTHTLGIDAIVPMLHIFRLQA